MYVPSGGLAIPRFGTQSTSAYDIAHLNPRFIHHWRPLPPKSKKASKASKATAIEHD
jgi:hypothetical protein